MKPLHHLATILSMALFTVPSCLLAQEPAAPQILTARIEEFRQKAFDYIKTKRPDLKPENLVFSGISYYYSPGDTPHLIHDTQGDHLSVEPPFTQSLTVDFEDPTTSVQQVENGQVMKVTKIIGVRYNTALTECVFIYEATDSKTVNIPPPDPAPR